MYRRSDNSESTASSRTAITGQPGKLPREGIISENKKRTPQNSRKTNFDTRKFDTRTVPTGARRGNASASGNNVIRQKNSYDRSNAMRQPYGEAQNRRAVQRSAPTQRTLQQTAQFSSTRTGSAPYLYGQHTQRRPAPRKRREPLYIIILRWLYIHRHVAAVTLGILLFACITIPLAAYAASTDHANNTPDHEFIQTAPENTDMFSAFLSNSPTDDSTAEQTVEDSDDVVQTEEQTSEEVTSDPAEQSEEMSDDPSDDVGSQSEDTESTVSDSSSISTEDNTGSEVTTEPAELITEPVEEEDDRFYVTVGFYDREAVSCLTGPATLREILATAGYTLRDTDRSSISLDEYIEGESWIMIDTVTYEAVTESEAIPFEVETYEVQTIPRGTTQTVTYGVNGSLDKVYTVEYVNGVEANRTFEYEYISSYPTNQVDYYGTGGTFYAPDGTLYSYSYYVNVRATYYNIYGNTASGMPTGNNVMAVDPSVFPLGTQVYVMNDYYDMGVKTAADTGGAIKGNIIDIWMDENHPYYYQFTAQGVCDMIAYVLD